MASATVPYHLDERLDEFAPGVPVDQEITADLPPGGAWQRMAVLYEQVAQVVAVSEKPQVVVSGDCTTSLGVLAGLQRGGHDVGIVWFDAHADFHTEDSTASGYLGGMPLALASGIGTPTLPEALRLQPVAGSRILLVDARDTDPGEQPLLDRAAVCRRPVDDLDDAVPAGELYLHIDVDVCDHSEVPGLLYPAANGPITAAVLPGRPSTAQSSAASRRADTVRKIGTADSGTTGQHGQSSLLAGGHTRVVAVRRRGRAGRSFLPESRDQ